MTERAGQGDGLRAALSGALGELWRGGNLQRRLDMAVEGYWAEKRARSPNPLVRLGEKFFSQSDEDGITREVCRRLGLSGGRAVEFGVGDGLENNSLILLFSGWSVGWVGGEDIAVRIPPGCRNLAFVKGWVTAENCAGLAEAASGGAGLAGIDLLGVDLDGNDLHVVAALLGAGLRPSVLIVEYNGKFPPPIRWRTRYDPGHRWDGSDYQGASLQAFVDLCAGHGYRLVACNLTGSNAYFVRAADAGAFADVPADPAALFVAADHNWFVERGHATSPHTVEAVLVS